MTTHIAYIKHVDINGLNVNVFLTAKEISELAGRAVRSDEDGMVAGAKRERVHCALKSIYLILILFSKHDERQSESDWTVIRISLCCASVNPSKNKVK